MVWSGNDHNFVFWECDVQKESGFEWEQSLGGHDTLWDGT